MSYKIIVARYNENIEWLHSDLDNCIIYNKGEPLHIKNEILLENVGRESGTYLQYIIDNYHNLPDIVIFTQGNISDHTYIAGYSGLNYLYLLKDQAMTQGKSSPIRIHHTTEIPNPSFDPDWNYQHGEYYLANNYYMNTPIVFCDWFKQNIKEKYPEPIALFGNAIFAVKKHLIMKHSVDYYENLLKFVNHQSNPSEGHFLERSWYYIFSE